MGEEEKQACGLPLKVDGAAAAFQRADGPITYLLIFPTPASLSFSHTSSLGSTKRHARSHEGAGFALVSVNFEASSPLYFVLMSVCGS